MVNASRLEGSIPFYAFKWSDDSIIKLNDERCQGSCFDKAK